MKDTKYHEPVLVKEVLSQLALLKDKKIIDATLGTGGHTLAMVKAGAEVLGIEGDPEIVAIAKERLAKSGPPSGWKVVRGNFREIDRIAQENGFGGVDAVLFDLGLANLQLTSPTRGFSFGAPEAKLDMRIDPTGQGVTGADLLNGLRKDQLEALFAEVLDFSSSRWLAKKVVEKRALRPISTVGDFLEICRGLRSKPKLNPATLPFLALRLAVNCELENLKEALPKSLNLLKKGGKLLVITFHSKEKEVIRGFSKDFVGPIAPSEDEIGANPRSRSAKLFVLNKN